MRKLLLMFLALGLTASAGTAMAVDLDNNGVQNDETYVPGVFNDNPDRDEQVVFPTSADTWQVSSYPYWWHVGDTVYGTHDVSLPTVDHVDVVLKISYSSLNAGGHVDLDLRLNGTTVGSFIITQADGTGYVNHSFDFAPMAPPFELRYYETNLVASGAGSVSLDETGLNSLTFSGGAVPTEETSWSQVKNLYR